MTENDREETWEQQLRAGLGESPPPDFAAWSAAHPDALAHLANPGSIHPLRRPFMTPLKLLAASVLLAAGLLLLRAPAGLEKNAFAAAIPGVDNPKTLTWTTTYFIRSTSRDGKRTWTTAERRLHAYRDSGLYRETFLNADGAPYAVEITDARAGRTLVLDLGKKSAVLKMPAGMPDPRGPFAWVGEAIRERMVAKVLPVRSISLQGTQPVDKTNASVVRAMIQEDETRSALRRDFLFDVNTKQLVGIWTPNDNGLNLDAAKAGVAAPEKEWSEQVVLASLVHEIVVDAPLDANDFRLDAPAGYAFEKGTKPTLTEEEMLAYLRAAVKFNGEVFPDSPYSAFDSARFNAASRKKEAEQSADEKDMIAQHDRFMLRGIDRPPVRQFVDDHAASGSFVYVGAGAKLGKAGQVVAWYTPKGATKPRAIYADLSVKDVNPSDLPLDLNH